MALARDEIARRIKAARQLRGIKQAELGLLLAQDGLGQEDVGRIEREEMQMSRSQRDAITRHLRLPERWLTSESVDEIVGYGELREPPSSGLISGSAATVEDLLDELKAATRTAEELLGRLGQRISKRELQSRRATDRVQPHPPAA
jgi:hypothetical protein